MRSVSEWHGKTDDQAIPPRVKVRVFDAFGGRCAVCTLQIAGKLRPAYDHKIALINGGENRERNLQLLCVPCHQVKTGLDVGDKSRTYRKRAKHLGIAPKKIKIQSRGFQRAAPQRSASRKIEKIGFT